MTWQGAIDEPLLRSSFQFLGGNDGKIFSAHALAMLLCSILSKGFRFSQQNKEEETSFMGTLATLNSLH